MPGFREMAIRRHADERAALMAEDRGRLVRQLAEQRQAAGLSQTEVAALMGTSQSAVARIESGTADVRASTLERYAAAVGSQIAWHLDHPAERAEGTRGAAYDAARTDLASAGPAAPPGGSRHTQRRPGTRPAGLARPGGCLAYRAV